MTALLISLLFGASVAAQPLPPQTTADSVIHKQIKEVTVYSLSSGSLALPYIAVDQAKLERFDYKTPADALQSETGISLSRDGVWATSVNVRGLSEQRLLFLVDGDRMQTATDIAAALSTVDMNSLDRIEVVKGAGSVLYGTGAMGGVVNFIYSRPDYTDYIHASAKVASGYQSANNLWSNSANVQVTNKDWYLIANGSYRTAQNTMTPAGVLPNSQFNDASFGIRGGMTYDNNQELKVGFNRYEAWNVGLPGGVAFPSAATVRYTDVTRNQLSGEYIFREISDVLRELSFKAYMQSINRNVENVVNTSKTILPSSLNTTSGFKATSKLYFNDYSQMVVGAETWFRNSQTARLNVVIAGTDTTVTGDLPTPKAKVFDAGVFAQHKWVLNPHHFTINSGVRFDFIRTENDTLLKEVFKYHKVAGERVYLDANRKVLINPSVQPELTYALHIDFEYQPVLRNKFTLSLANSYRAASVEERFKYIYQGAALHEGNINLKPEKGLFSNLNYTYTGNKLMVKADVFANYLFDLITEKKISLLPDVYQNQNVSKALFVGAEAELQWRINRRLSVDANASYVQGRDVDADAFLPLIPPMHGIVTLDYKLPAMAEAALSVVWANSQNQIASGETATAGYVIYNFDVHSVALKVKNTYFKLFGGIDNILNTAYYNHLSTNRGAIKLEPGRNVFAKVQWSW